MPAPSCCKFFWLLSRFHYSLHYLPLHVQHSTMLLGLHKLRLPCEPVPRVSTGPPQSFPGGKPLPPVWAEVEALSVGNRAWTCSWEISAPFRFARPATNSECDLDKALPVSESPGSGGTDMGLWFPRVTSRMLRHCAVRGLPSPQLPWISPLDRKNQTDTLSTRQRIFLGGLSFIQSGPEYIQRSFQNWIPERTFSVVGGVVSAPLKPIVKDVVGRWQKWWFSEPHKEKRSQQTENLSSSHFSKVTPCSCSEPAWAQGTPAAKRGGQTRLFLRSPLVLTVVASMMIQMHRIAAWVSMLVFRILLSHKPLAWFFSLSKPLCWLWHPTRCYEEPGESDIRSISWFLF